jgi:hypothetical protein
VLTLAALLFVLTTPRRRALASSPEP